MTLTTRQLSEADLRYVVEHASADDRAEMAAAGIADPTAVFLAALPDCIDSGAVLADGEPIAAWGVQPHPYGGLIWMVGTDRVAESPRAFGRLSRVVIDALRPRYPRLLNLVHAKHERALRWLAWLGFTIGREPVGPGGAFLAFSMEDRACATR